MPAMKHLLKKLNNRSSSHSNNAALIALTSAVMSAHSSKTVVAITPVTTAMKSASHVTLPATLALSVITISAATSVAMTVAVSVRSEKSVNPARSASSVASAHHVTNAMSGMSARPVNCALLAKPLSALRAVAIKSKNKLKPTMSNNVAIAISVITVKTKSVPHALSVKAAHRKAEKLPRPRLTRKMLLPLRKLISKALVRPLKKSVHVAAHGASVVAVTVASASKWIPRAAQQ